MPPSQPGQACLPAACPNLLSGQSGLLQRTADLWFQHSRRDMLSLTSSSTLKALPVPREGNLFFLQAKQLQGATAISKSES